VTSRSGAKATGAPLADLQALLDRSAPVCDWADPFAWRCDNRLGRLSLWEAGGVSKKKKKKKKK
jgi:hypothetical protein